MNEYASTIAWICYLEICHLASICRLLTSTPTATLVTTFVLSGIDHCNSLMSVFTRDVTSHMQQIQNHAAQIILCHTNSSNITTHLKLLHWLPVKIRSTYKIACLCYHWHNSTAPSYVTNMLQKKPPHTRNTRSSSDTMPLLKGNAHSKAELVDRLFSFDSSTVWNSIPNDVRCTQLLSSCTSRLKSFLFCSAYKECTFSLIAKHMCMSLISLTAFLRNAFMCIIKTKNIISYIVIYTL